jgi:hypothetical protein
LAPQPAASTAGEAFHATNDYDEDEHEPDFGASSFYLHLLLLCIVMSTQTNLLACIALLAFLFYGSRPPVGRDATRSSRWTPPAWYWAVNILAALLAIAGPVCHMILEPNWVGTKWEHLVSFLLGSVKAPSSKFEHVAAFSAPGAMLLFSMGMLGLGGDAKDKISSAYNDIAKSAMKTIKDKGLISSELEEGGVGFILAHSGYLWLLLCGFVFPCALGSLYALLLCCALFLHACVLDADDHLLWHPLMFWRSTQCITAVALCLQVLFQFLPLINFYPDKELYVEVLGLAFQLPLALDKWHIYVFLHTQFWLYASAAHHHTVCLNSKPEQGSSTITEASSGAYGTFEPGEKKIVEDGEASTASMPFWKRVDETVGAVTSHSHHCCALAMCFWALWQPSVLSAVLLIAGLSAWLVDGATFAVVNPYLLSFSLVYLMLQLVFNIPHVSFGMSTPVSAMVGFQHFSRPSLPIPGQLLLSCFIALNVYAKRQVSRYNQAQATLSDLTQLGTDGSITSEKTLNSSWNTCKLLFGFIFSNAFFITLATAYVYSVSELNLVNTGYLVLSLFFFCFPGLAPWAWVAFVVYAQCVVITLFSYQFVPAESALTGWKAKEIGLRMYPVAWRKPGIGGPWVSTEVLDEESTFDHVLGAPVFILLFALVQYAIFKQVRAGLAASAQLEGLSTPRPVGDAISEALERELPSVQKLLRTVGQIIEEFSGLLALGSLVLLVTVLPPNVINYGYLTAIFIVCWTYRPYGHGQRTAFRWSWTLIVFYTALVLITQYVMEFPKWDADGLERDLWRWTGFKRVEHSRIVLFLPTTFTLLSSLYYTKILSAEGQNERVQAGSDETHYEPRELYLSLPVLQTTGRLLKRFCVLHASKLFSLFMFLIALRMGNGVGFFLCVYVVVDLFFISRGGLPVWPIMIFAQIYLSAEYAYQVTKKGHYGPLTATAKDSSFARWADWVGFAAWGDVSAGIQPCLWISLLGALSSSASYYWALEQPSDCRPVEPSISEPCLLFARKAVSTGEPFQKLREHLNQGFAKHGILLTLTMMLVASCVRQNAMSYFYLSVASLSLFASTETLARSTTLWLVLYLIMASFILFQFIVIWNPIVLPWREKIGDGTLVPAFGRSVEDEAVLPTTTGILALHIPEAYRAWLFLHVSDKYHLIADFFAMLFVALQAKAAWLPPPGASPLETVEENDGGKDVFDSMLVGAIRILICDYSPTLVTVCIAVTGCIEVTMVNFPYLLVSLVFLSYGSTLMRTRNPWWRFLRFYNIALLVLYNVLSAPFTSLASSDPVSIQYNSGLWANPTPQIVIFFLLLMQNEIFNWSAYAKSLGVSALRSQAGRVRESERLHREKLNLHNKVLVWLEDSAARQQRLQMLDFEKDSGVDILEVPVAAPPEAVEAPADPVPEPVEFVLREGVLQVREGTIFTSWVPHYVSLKRGAMYVYKSDAAEEAKMSTPILTVAAADITEWNTSVKGDESKGEFAWSLTYGKTKVRFRCGSSEDRDGWLESVQLMNDVAHGRAQVGDDGDEESADVETEERNTVLKRMYALLPDALEWLAERLEKYDEYYTESEEESDKSGSTKDKGKITKAKATTTTALRFFKALQGTMNSHTALYCYGMLVLNHALNGGVVTMIPPILVFTYAISSKTRPAQIFWHFLVCYTLAVVTIQYIIKLPAFCGLDYMYGIKGSCAGLTNVHDRYLTYPYVLGIRAGGAQFLSHAWLDIAVLLTIGVHIRRLQSTGRWSENGKVAVEMDILGDDEESQFTGGLALPKHVMEEQYRAARQGMISKDYYSLMFFADFAAFVFCALGFSKIYSQKSLTASIAGNSLDWGFVSVMILLFFNLVLDRILYLCRSDNLKWAMQIFLVFLFHIVLIAAYPMQQGIGVLRVYYLIKAVYFAFSAMQIKTLYPIYTQGEFLTNDEEPSNMTYYAYCVYRTIPFLYELRCLLDWACTRTSLDFYQWFKLEDIHGQLFVNRCIISQYKKQREDRKEGQAQSVSTKLLVGALAFASLCVLLWLPLLLFSSGSALMESNPPMSATMVISLFDGSRHYRLFSVTTQKQRSISTSDLDKMDRQSVLEPYFTKSGSQVYAFASTSGTVFDAPPTLIEHLIDTTLLGNGTSTVTLSVDTDWERKLPVSNKIVSYQQKTTLDKAKRVEIGNMLKKIYHSKATIESSFTINGAIADVLHLPGNQPVTALGQHTHNLLFTFHRQMSKYSSEWAQWWDVHFIVPKQKPSEIEVIAVSDEVIGSYMGIGTFISQLGVVGLYVSVVFVVGRLLRAFVSNLQTRIMFEDMEDVSQPMKITRHIYLARQEAGTALDNIREDDSSLAMALEEHLYWELIRLYRQPDKLYKYTTLRVAPEGAMEDDATAPRAGLRGTCVPGRDHA